MYFRLVIYFILYGVKTDEGKLGNSSIENLNYNAKSRKKQLEEFVKDWIYAIANKTKLNDAAQADIGK